MEEGNGENLNVQPEPQPQIQAPEPATQEQVPTELTPAMDLLGKAINRSLPLILKGLVVSIVPVVGSFLAIFVASFAFFFLKAKYGISPITFLPFAIMILPILYFSAWQYSAIIAIAAHPDPENASKKELFENGWDMAASFMVLSIWSLLIICGGALCFIIPGIIFAGWFMFSGYVLFCENLRGREALARSKQLIEGYWWAVGWRVGVLFLILFIVFFGIGMAGKFVPGFKNLKIVVEPILRVISILISSIFTFELYKELSRIKGPSPAGELSLFPKGAGGLLFSLLGVVFMAGMIGATVYFPARLNNQAKEGLTKGNLSLIMSSTYIYYSDKEGIFPETLDELVPAYIKEIPAAKLGDSKWAGEGKNTWKPDPTPETDITPEDLDNSTAWMYNSKTGSISVNNTGKDSKGVSYLQWGKTSR